MNGPIPAMYSIKPIIHFSEGIALPTNMYKMKNIYSNFHEHKPDIIERNEHNVEEVSSDPIIEDIENRQSIILEQLKELQNQMDLLRKQLVQSTPSSPKKDSSKYSTHAVKKTCKPVFSENGILGDVVINADPKYPPYSLLGVKKIWSDSINLKISSYVHSSVVDIPNKDKLSVFSSSNSDSPADVPTLNITLVWKNIGPDCEFIVSPLISCAISGEVNVLRYIHRQVNADADILEETKLDGFLDICHCLIHASSQKEKQSFVRKLNATLGKSDWFGGSSISVSDLAAWSTIQNVDNLELVQKLSKWMEQCNKHIGQNRIVQTRNHVQDSEPINMRSNQKPSVKNSLDSNTVKSSVIRSSSNPVVMKRIVPFSVSQVSPCKHAVINEIVDPNAVSKSTSNIKQSHLNSNKRKRKFPPQKLSSSRKCGSSDGYSKNLVTKYQGNFQQFQPQNFMGYNYDRNGGNILRNYSSLPRDYFYLPSSHFPFYKNSSSWQTNMNWNFTDRRFLYQDNFDSYRRNNFASGSKLVVPTLPKVTQPKKLGPQSNRRKIRYPFRNIYWTRKRGNNAGSYRRKVDNHPSNTNNYFQKRKPVHPMIDYDYQNYGIMKNSESYSSVPACSSIYRPRFNITPYNNLPSQVNFNTYHYNNYYQYKAGNCNSVDPVKTYFELDQSRNSYNYDTSYFYHNKPAAANFSNQSLFTRSPLFGSPMRGSRQKNISHKGSHH